jgi:hypothetical protein
LEDVRLAERLCTFIKDFCDDLCCLQLLLFFARHPGVRFNRTAVLQAARAVRQFDAIPGLKRLIDRKIVVTYTENGITLYGLCKEEPIHSTVVDLCHIDQRQWQILVEQILKSQGI